MPQRIPSHKPPFLRSRARRDESIRPSAVRGAGDRAHPAWRPAVLTRDGVGSRACGRVCGNRREAEADRTVPVSRDGERFHLGNGSSFAVAHRGRASRVVRRRAARERLARSGLRVALPEGRVGRITPGCANINPGCFMCDQSRYMAHRRLASR